MQPETKILPLFPLENVVLFPHALLSIQIPAYTNVLGLGDYVVQDAEICFGLLKKTKRKNLSSPMEPAEVFRRGCVGRVVNKNRDKKNEYKVLIEGIERVSIIEEVQDKPIILARLEVIHDFIDLDNKTETNKEMKHTLCITEELGELLPHFRPIIRSILAAYPHPAIIADLIAYTFVKDSYAKQSILEELDTHRRLKLINIQIENMIRRLSRQRNRDTRT